MQCTHCKSDNTQRLSVVYQAGTHDISSTGHISGTFYGSNIGTGYTTGTIRTTETSQSYLASRASPPKKKSYNRTILFMTLWAFGFFYQALSFILFLPFLAIAIFSWYRASNFNDKIYPALREKWLHSWHCNKCGTIYSEDYIKNFPIK